MSRLTDAQLIILSAASRSRLLGALLDAVSHGLQVLPDVHLQRLPRMADFARWAAAWETA